jgi:4-amino-4-deoxy-L-arabinose transferase-like glycosyltransferase
MIKNLVVSKSINFKALFSDARFWIILFFIIRLFNINSPIFDSHDWRQADGYSIARNFFEIDPNILYPRVDSTGSLSGILGTEFPIMNYIVYCLYLLFGIDWWQGRLLNLIVASIGSYFFYKTTYKFIKQEIALYALLLLMGSIWFAHSRKFMPDVFSVSLVLSGIYFGWQYLKGTKKSFNLILYFLLISIGLMSKLPSFIVLSLLLPAILDPSILFKRKLIFILISISTLFPPYLWYFYWVPKLTDTFGFASFYMGASLIESFRFLTHEWNNMLHRFYADALYYIGFIGYLLGVFFIIKHIHIKLITVFISASVLQLIFMLKGGESFVHLSYYIIPFVPIMVLIASYGISNIKWDWVKYAFIFAVITEGIINQQHDFMPKQSQNYKLELENIANQYTLPGDLIAVNNDFNPSYLYFSHRKGWSFNGNQLGNIDYFKSMANNGCQLLIWDKHKNAKPEAIPFFTIEVELDDFIIYKPSGS